MDQKSLKKQSDTQFVCKLCDMIEKYPLIINWNLQGDKMIIYDILKMEELVLPQYFRHSNFASFIRQLNMYNFHKLYKDGNQIGFINDIFKKGNEKNFHFIHRKKKIKQQQMFTLQFQQKNQHILKKLKDQPKISESIKDITQGLLEYKYTVTQNIKKMKTQLDLVYRQLKDCRSKKISQVIKQIRDKLMQQLNELIKSSKELDRVLETQFLQEKQKQNKEFLANQLNSQYYVSIYDQKLFDCNRIRSRHSFVPMHSHCGFFSSNDGNNSHPFFSVPRIISVLSDANNQQKTITKQEQQSEFSMEIVDAQDLENILKERQQQQKSKLNTEEGSLKSQAP